MLASGLDANERHSAKITFKYANGAHGLQYVKTSKHGAIIKSNDNKKYVQFIGDSINEGTLIRFGQVSFQEKTALVWKARTLL